MLYINIMNSHPLLSFPFLPQQQHLLPFLFISFIFTSQQLCCSNSQKTPFNFSCIFFLSHANINPFLYTHSNNPIPTVKMFFKTTILFSLLATSLAAPITSSQIIEKRAPVLRVQNYSQFQVSDGVAGDGLNRVLAKFPVNMSNPASVDPQDVAILKAARETAEAAETKAGGFNEAIKAAGGEKTPAGAALQRGKILNKILKLQLQVMTLTIEGAQGKDTTAKLAEQQKKLAKNIETDKKAAGERAAAVDFQGTSQP
ncbi:hypothetical protein QBC35DRAFT_509612 [Podospora australis]|uniref:Small secreted protein n=1 Tax=Podospora australis TaxID=1536484 RepID=A0AAN7AE39_9PEZI|nr:hypothetical protein QBC35DRAFT_509612 [Podospora australis]